jgi:phosphohistidine phosphatase
MRLYLVQHGEAVAKEVDPDRPLSEHGREDIVRLAKWLEQRGVEVREIRHSGKTRARQTAELLMPLLQAGGKIGQHDGLAPNDPPKELLRSIETRQTDLLVASHMPFVARAVAAAVTGEPDRPMVYFQPGSVAGLERDDSRTWRITLLIGPGLLDSVI